MSDEHKPMPDLREVFERARRLDADAVDGLFGEEDERQNVLELVPRDEGPSVRLDAFLASVRDELDERAAQRALQTIPSPPAARRQTRWALIGAAAAATLLLSWGIYGVATGASNSSAAQLAEAPMTARAGNGSALAQPLPPATPTHSAVEIVEPEPEVEPAVESESASDSEPGDATDTAALPAAEEPADSSADGAKPSKKVEDPTDSLEARAQAAWKAGELALAEKLLRKLIKTTRSRSRREQAYGDLLSLLEVRGNESRTRQLWRSYLRKYPQGRYADDLQARICRSEATSDCWTEYLKKHPKGAHRREAESKTRP